ncbi:MAG: aconitate hydratase AcnA [Verrucomicrobia bacterium]|nr:aconitate hydratase AcnA [Verrucomicrobiota bacterium]
MNKKHTLFGALQEFPLGNGQAGQFYSLPALERAGIAAISRLPVSIRIVLESVLRNCDGRRVSEASVKALAQWKAVSRRTEEIPFVVARIVLQDFTGVPLLVDLAAMRSAVARMGKNPKMIEPLVPVDLVVDHSVQVDFAGSSDSMTKNLEMEFRRNRERYQFLKWGMQAFETFKVVPPGIGIVHQVNLEYLAKGVILRDGLYFPDTLVGTDSHTTMINGLGIVGWGVGGIEAEAGMLGQPVYFLTPDVVGVHLTGSIREGVTATDVALHLTQMLRKEKVVGKFVEYFGAGAASLPVADRATIANMAPEYGATMGYFPVDEETVKYLRATGRTEDQCALFENYFRAQDLFGMPRRGQLDYSVDLELNLGDVTPSVAGPKRPQDRIELNSLKRTWEELLANPVADGGYGKKGTPTLSPVDLAGSPSPAPASGDSGSEDREIEVEIRTGDVVIAAITSCTNTSNPSVMIAAGLLARKAVERGLTVRPEVKASLAPGSRVVSDYLAKTGLQPYLDQLGFNLVGYGCTTCIGNSGPLASAIEEAIVAKDLIAASVLSGNRNFEARVHQSVKANFLMSPPLVVAFALAGRVNIDLTSEPIGLGSDGTPVFLRDIWPTLTEIREQMEIGLAPEIFRKLYQDFAGQNPMWNEIPAPTGEVYAWDEKSTYIQEPPFFEGFSMEFSASPEIVGAKALAVFGDSVTTDHISPAGSIKSGSPAAKYLVENGVAPIDFNSYGSRRGNDRVMTRGTFGNVRIKNLMITGSEGGVTKFQPDGQLMSIFDAAIKYQAAAVPLIIIAGQEYGTGSSRDWAAKGTRLMGVRAVVAQSFERIHRSNLVGMGVLPLQFPDGVNATTLNLSGTETYDVIGANSELKPQQNLILRILRMDESLQEVSVRCRIDTPIEIEYYEHGGILPYVLRELIRSARS